MLLAARVSALADKLKEFTPEEIEVLREILTHHYRQRSELQAKFYPKIVDSATNKAVAMRIIDLNAGTYTFSPDENWKEYLEDALLTQQPVGPAKKSLLERFLPGLSEDVQ
jgi:hypothetical protein